MQKIRAAIAAIIALALAGLPVPAAAMHASMSAGSGIADTTISGTAAHDHYGPQAENCDRHTNKGCDSSDACALKCSILSANVVAEMDLAPLPAPSLVLTVAAERLQPAKAHPPLPPPRL